MNENGFAESLARVRERIAAATARSRRKFDDVRLLAVTKQFPARAIQLAYENGLREFGENYVQEFEAKRGEVSNLRRVRYHLIGHLQSNKARKAADLFQVIQTVDSAKLARRLSETGVEIEIMIEVKLSSEPSKSGVSDQELPQVVDSIRETTRLKLTGLMTVPEWSEDAERSRPSFARLRELAEAHGISELSMGMSNDLEVAIEEGATIVRVGTALFGRRKRP